MKERSLWPLANTVAYSSQTGCLLQTLLKPLLAVHMYNRSHIKDIDCKLREKSDMSHLFIHAVIKLMRAHSVDKLICIETSETSLMIAKTEISECKSARCGESDQSQWRGCSNFYL